MIGALVLLFYGLAFCGLVLYGLHRGWLLLTYRRLGRERRETAE